MKCLEKVENGELDAETRFRNIFAANLRRRFESFSNPI